jgi:hypothetical protein
MPIAKAVAIAQIDAVFLRRDEVVNQWVPENIH